MRLTELLRHVASRPFWLNHRGEGKKAVRSSNRHLKVGLLPACSLRTATTVLRGILLFRAYIDWRILEYKLVSK